MPFNVTDNDIDDGAPDYSPAGTKIAYSAFDGNDYEIYTINATGGTPFQVTDNDTYDQTPSYSPDGEKIAYSCHEGNVTPRSLTTARSAR